MDSHVQRCRSRRELSFCRLRAEPGVHGRVELRVEKKTRRQRTESDAGWTPEQRGHHGTNGREKAGAFEREWRAGDALHVGRAGVVRVSR